MINILRKKSKYFEGIISPILIKHREKLQRNVLNSKKANKTKDPNGILKYKKHRNVVKLKNQSK